MWYLICDVPLVQAFAAAIRLSSSCVEVFRDGRLVARSATYNGVNYAE